MEAELRDRNQLLEAANVSLHSNLTSAQEKIGELTGHHKELREEIKELNRRLEKNLLILENRNIDPVSGELILASVEESSKLRAETKVSTDNLLKELKMFSEKASEQKALVQGIMAKWQQAEKNRKQFLEQQEAFQSELDHFRTSLQQVEKRLES